MIKELREAMESATAWKIIAFFVILLTTIVLAICDSHNDMEELANYKAWCDSISGKFSGTTCFVDGVEMKMEEK